MVSLAWGAQVRGRGLPDQNAEVSRQTLNDAFDGRFAMFSLKMAQLLPVHHNPGGESLYTLKGEKFCVTISRADAVQFGLEMCVIWLDGFEAE